MRIILILFFIFRVSRGYDFEGPIFPRNIPNSMMGNSLQQPRQMNVPSVMVSQAGGDLEIPPIYIPDQQAFVMSNLGVAKSSVYFWEEEMAQTGDKKNCLLCDRPDAVGSPCSGAPSCVFCEKTVTTLCEKGAPCLRCTVIKNPHFRCVPGEKYMDECDSCRCTDGRGGWCTNMFCEFRPLHIYAMKLSESEMYTI